MNLEPTFSRVPDGDESTGREVVDLARAYDIPLDEWQADIVAGILRETPEGGWACSQAGLVVSRQSGKGNCILALELAGLLLFNETILHTAHATKTSSDAFSRLWAIIDGHHELSRRVKRQSMATGAEFIEFVSGARISFTTRSASAGRGLSIDRLIIDEAEDWPQMEVAALQPTVFSRPKAQTLLFGTAPGPFHDSESFETTRKAAHEGLNPRLAWWEWCAPAGHDVDDEEMWVRVNPAVATGRVPLQAVRDDRSVLPVDAFRAERLSQWVSAGSAAVFDASTWGDLEDRDSVPVKDLAIGIDAPPSRESATICVAGRREDGRLHLEWYETDQGTAWLPTYLAQKVGPKVRAVVVDDRNPAAEVDWPSGGIRVTTTTTRDVANAAGALFDAIAEGTVRHRGQVELSRGVLGAKQRPMVGGQAFGWHRSAPGSSVLIAASLALWGVTADKPRRPRIGVKAEGTITVL